MNEQLEPIAIDADWLRIRDLAAQGAENDAFLLLKEKLKSDGDRVMTPQELRTNVLVALSGFATGKTIEDRVSAMRGFIEELHESYDWLRKMKILTPVTDVQALIVAGEWVQIASIFRHDFSRPDWGVMAADIALKKNPGNVAALTTKMASKADLGLFSAAENIYLKAKRISPESSYLHASWARIQRNRGRYADALESAFKAGARSPSPETMRLIGSVFEAWGEIGAAVAYYKKADRIPEKVSDRATFALIQGYKEMFSRALEEGRLIPEELKAAIEKLN